MLRDLVSIFYVCLLALGLGVWSAESVTRNWRGADDLTIGVWHASPDHGGSQADPYALAWIARHGDLPLGNGEGVRFRATRATDGTPLDGACDYRLAGLIATSRQWTLHAELDEGGTWYQLPRTRAVPVAHADDIFYTADGGIDLTMSRAITPGSWRPLPADVGTFALVFTLLDTGIANNAGLTELVMPRIDVVRCRSQVQSEPGA